MLWTCSCTVQTQSDHCQSIKVSIILCVLSLDNFFAISLASAVDGIFYVTLNKILLSSMHITSAMDMPHAHTIAVISKLAPNCTIRCGLDLCVLKCVLGLRLISTWEIWSFYFHNIIIIIIDIIGIYNVILKIVFFSFVLGKYHESFKTFKLFDRNGNHQVCNYFFCYGFLESEFRCMI